MLKYVNYDIVFQEYPDEISLAVNLSLCPNRCVGCHSAQLREDIGEELTEERLFSIIDSYRNEITCVGLMGGDNDPAMVLHLLARVKEQYHGELKTGWYSGRMWQPEPEQLVQSLNYLKLGPYIPERGPLNSKETNQHMYRIQPDGTTEDITYRFWKKY